MREADADGEQIPDGLVHLGLEAGGEADEDGVHRAEVVHHLALRRHLARGGLEVCLQQGEVLVGVVLVQALDLGVQLGDGVQAHGALHLGSSSGHSDGC